MSAAVQDPPVNPDTQNTQPGAVGGPVTLPDLDVLLRSGKGPDKSKEEPPKQEEPKKEAAAAGEKQADSPESKPEEPKKEEPKQEPPKKEQELNFRQLREAREAAEGRAAAAEKERDEFKTRIEELTKNPAIPEEVKSKLELLEARSKEFDDRDKELQELRTQVRAADITRDPEFQRKYTKGIGNLLTQMQDTAISAGIDPKEVKAAMTAWNEDKFGEWMENMPAGAKAKFQTAWGQAITLDQERRSVIADAEANWEKISKERQEAAAREQRAAQEATQKLARQVSDEAISKLPEDMRDDEQLRWNLKAAMDNVTSNKWGAKDILGQIATNQVLVKVMSNQRSLIDGLQQENETLKKKVAEQEAFIKDRSGAVPAGGAAGGEVKLPEGAIWDQITVPTRS